ncbi:unnamed protein product [Calicophoron daubneyi]|uniref:C2 domain-containing protein n=1 Tax=Calicophoron daubneyi TaxID=300641 RepID=A0AAV2T2Z1_CALDB
MVSAETVRSNNPDNLTKSSFLVNLAVTFHVVSIPLAIFIFILVLIGCVLFIVCIILIVRCCLHQRYIAKRKKRTFKSVYVDQIPGVQQINAEEKSGMLEYSLEYNLKQSELAVGVQQAMDLRGRKEDEEVDPYVVVTLQRMPTSKTKGEEVKTHVRKHTSHPTWQQQFIFSVQEAEVPNIVITFEVFDYDSIGQDRSLGRLRVALRDLDMSEFTGRVLEKTELLGVSQAEGNGMGELCVGLGYYPQAERIDVTIYEARQLNLGGLVPEGRHGRLEVQVELYLGRKSLGKGNTKHKHELVNPYFNEKMSFSVKPKDIDQCSALCRLVRKRRLGMRRTLGEARIGEGASLSNAVKQWEDMVAGPNKTHVMWHALLPPDSDTV